MPAQVRAILWAQFRTLLNFRRGESASGWILPAFMMLLWYGAWTALAAFASSLCANPAVWPFLKTALPAALLFICLYWQLAPLMAASLGASLDLKKLLVYPVPHRHLFGIEVLLRISTCLEMLLLVAGIAIGLARNPLLPHPAAGAAFGPFVLFNLLVAAGLRNQLERLMARRRIREVAVLLLVLAAALPQVLVVTGLPPFLRNLFHGGYLGWWPWSVTARLALGEVTPWTLGALLAWTALAWIFGRVQFERNLRFDFQAAESTGKTASAGRSRLEPFYRLPALVLSDPLAAIVEKELRSLSRSPRFRLVFIMGFTFGLLIFLPVFLRARSEGSFSISADHLAMLGAYALLLLGDVAFWNVFGFDRSAAQVYFLLPVRISRVLVAKNIATAIFVFLEMAAITLVWTAARLPLAPLKILEAFAAVGVLALYLMASGNLSSIYYPRPVNPEKSTGAGSAARTRLLLLLIYPAAALPVLLAYGARYAFRSDGAWWIVLSLVAAAGAGFYWVALDTAVTKVEERKDRLMQVLGRSEGPLALA